MPAVPQTYYAKSGDWVSWEDFMGRGESER